MVNKITITLDRSEIERLRERTLPACGLCTAKMSDENMVLRALDILYGRMAWKDPDKACGVQRPGA